jgi:MFS family permease
MYTGANMGVIISSFIVSKADRGQILSAIYYGALSTQFLGGVLSTKFGAKRVLLAGVTLWTTCVSTRHELNCLHEVSTMCFFSV